MVGGGGGGGGGGELTLRNSIHREPLPMDRISLVGTLMLL